MEPCSHCFAELAEGSRFCPSCGARLGAPTPGGTRTSAPSSAASQPSGGRFLPGTMLAGRYRIIGLLGRGGMGEVYRADDLKLGQTVALKFLPAELERDRERLERFLNEVKLARQVAHPNVCRVYDVGEVEDVHFISMEFVDGEELASLLRQIGRLPQEKALQVARELCAGLAAAHDQGILHRDLKPANVMIDGRGRVRITDFGLASAAEPQGDEIRAGTPFYMAPEQLAGKQFTRRSDIYSLGLVLYEIFTGKRPFEADSPSTLKRLHEQSTPTNPSDHVRDLDPVVERAILECLEREPADRPASALAVAAALPGGDPLAMALAAGETPSPEMVAAAGPRGALRGPVALGLLAFVIGGLVVCAYLHPKMTLYGRVPMSRSVAALTENARQIAERLGYTDPPADWVSYLESDYGLTEYLAGRDATVSRWKSLSEPGQMLLRLFYRQSPRSLVPLNGNWIGLDDPPKRPGDIFVSVNLEGRLVFFLAVPPAADHKDGPAPEPDWSNLFSEAGLDMAAYAPTRPTVFEFQADSRAAWSGKLPAHGGIPVRIEAAAWHGKPVYFEEILPSDDLWSAGTMDSAETKTGPGVGWTIAILLLITVLAIAVLLAVRNVRLGRGDRKGALRLALVVLAANLLSWVIGGHHVAGIGELQLLGIAASWTTLLAVISWIIYIALEPYVRRMWPRLLVSWSRLIAGRLRDPLVGRDLLIGLAFGVAVRILYYVGYRAPEWFGAPAPFIAWFGLEPMRGTRFAVETLLDLIVANLPLVLIDLLVLVLLRLVLRRKALVVAAFVSLFAWLAATQLIGSTAAPRLWPLAAVVGIVQASIIAVLVFRFGMLAMVGSFLVTEGLKGFPTTADVSTPYFGTSLVWLVAVVALALYGFTVCRAGQPLFAEAVP